MQAVKNHLQIWAESTNFTVSLSPKLPQYIHPIRFSQWVKIKGEPELFFFFAIINVSLPKTKISNRLGRIVTFIKGSRAHSLSGRRKNFNKGRGFGEQRMHSDWTHIIHQLSSSLSFNPHKGLSNDTPGNEWKETFSKDDIHFFYEGEGLK